MTVRLGLLQIKEIDENATTALIALLRNREVPVIVIEEAAIGDQRHWIEEVLRRWSDEEELDLICTLGGTMPAPGPSHLECVPEATMAVLERSLPGFSEQMRSHALMQTSLAALHRGVCGIRGRTLILNLPQGTATAVLFLEAVVDLIAPTLAFLHGNEKLPTIEDDLELVENNSEGAFPSEASDNPFHHKLDTDEFVRFLQRRRSEE